MQFTAATSLAINGDKDLAVTMLQHIVMTAFLWWLLQIQFNWDSGHKKLVKSKSVGEQERGLTAPARWQARLQFSREHLDWTEEQWKTVLFD